MAQPLVLDVPTVTNWDDMEKIYHHMFYNELRVAPEDQPVLFIENPRAPKAQREKCTQIMFETFNVPAFHLGIGGVLALRATGRSTGLVIDMGHGQSWIIPVIEGNALHSHINLARLGGGDITQSLTELLSAKGYDFNTTAERELVRDIKEKLGYVALNASKEGVKSTVEKTYELPDGKVISVGQERYQAPEILFQGPENLGDKTVTSIMRCPAEQRQFLTRNVVLCGGNSMFEGLTLRLQKELQGRLREHQLECRILAPPERKTLPWIGGSITASLSSTTWMSKADYDEHGPGFVHVRFPNSS